jgi:hypothetical protein
VQVAARGSGGRQLSAAHGYLFTPLRVSHDPEPGRPRFASRSIQVYILLFPFLVLCLITWPLCHVLSGRPLGSSLSGLRRLPCQWRAVSDFGLQISQWKCACIFVLAITIHSICRLRSIQPNAHSSSASSAQVFPCIFIACATFERALKKTSVSPLKLPRKYSG